MNDYGWLCESCLFEPCLFHSPDDEEAVRHFYGEHHRHRFDLEQLEETIGRNIQRLKANEMWGWVRFIDLIAFSGSGEALRKRKPGVQVWPLCGGRGLVWVSKREALRRKRTVEDTEARREKAFQTVLQSQREAERTMLAALGCTDDNVPEWARWIDELPEV